MISRFLSWFSGLFEKAPYKGRNIRVHGYDTHSWKETTRGFVDTCEICGARVLANSRMPAEMYIGKTLLFSIYTDRPYMPSCDEVKMIEALE